MIKNSERLAPLETYTGRTDIPKYTRHDGSNERVYGNVIEGGSNNEQAEVVIVDNLSEDSNYEEPVNENEQENHNQNSNQRDVNNQEAPAQPVQPPQSPPVPEPRVEVPRPAENNSLEAANNSCDSSIKKPTK